MADSDETTIIEDLPDHSQIPKEERMQLALTELRDAWVHYENEQQKPTPTTQKKPPKLKKPNAGWIAAQWGLSKSTLTRRFSGKTLNRREAHTAQRKLNDIEEKALADWIKRMEGWGFPPMVWRVRQMADELLKDRGINNGVGINWVSKFLSRQPDLTERWSKSIDKDRISGLNWTNTWFWFWFNLLDATLKKYNIQPEDIWNLDEKGFAMGKAGSVKVVCQKSTLQAHMAEPGNREWATILECISAAGKILSAFVIFKAKVQKESWQNELTTGSGNSVCLSENGWTNNDLCFEWFKRIFEPQSRKHQKGEFRLLIVDGHASHVCSNVIQFCQDHQIVLLCLPSHTTHALQPLDVSYFGPLAQRYRNAMLRFTTLGRSYTISKEDFLILLQRCRDETAKESTIKGAFKKTGIYPYDPLIIFERYPIPKPVALESARPFTPPEMILSSSDGTHFSIPLATPGNAAGVDEIIKGIKSDSLDPVYKVLLLDKLHKAACSQMASRLLLQKDNEALQLIEERKKEKAKRSNKLIDGELQRAQVLTEGVLNERRRIAAERIAKTQRKTFDKDFKRCYQLEALHLLVDAYKWEPSRGFQKRNPNYMPVASDHLQQPVQYPETFADKDGWIPIDTLDAPTTSAIPKTIRKPARLPARKPIRKPLTAPIPELREELPRTTRSGRLVKDKKHDGEAAQAPIRINKLSLSERD